MMWYPDHGYDSSWLFPGGFVLGLVACHVRNWLGQVGFGAMLVALACGFAGHEVLLPYCRHPVEMGMCVVELMSCVKDTWLRMRKRNAPKFPNWTYTYEMLQGVLFCIGKNHGQNVCLEPNVQVFARNCELAGCVTAFASCQLYGTTCTQVVVGNLEHLWLRHKSVASSSPQFEDARDANRLVVLFMHGGGFALLCPRLLVHTANRLASEIRDLLSSAPYSLRNVQIDVLLGNYRKTPLFRYPAQVDDTMTVYDYLVGDCQIPNDHIIMCGDSAGGGLVMSSLLRMKQTQRGFPRAAILSCPFVNTQGGEKPSENCILSEPYVRTFRTNYIAGAGPRDLSHASPVTCDLSGLPPLMIQSGDCDTLHENNALLLAKKTKQDKVSLELDVHQSFGHEFTLFPHFILPYSSVGIQRMAAFAAKQFQSSRHEKKSL